MTSTPLRRGVLTVVLSAVATLAVGLLAQLVVAWLLVLALAVGLARILGAS